MLISGSPVKKDGDDPYFIFGGAQSYINCEEVLNKVANVYLNTEFATSARSVKVEDINKALGITVSGNKVYKTNDASKTNLDEWHVMGETYTYESGDYAPENYMGTGTKRVGDIVTQDAYWYSYEDAGVTTSDSDVLYNLLFKGTTDADNFAKSYWLASPGAFVDSHDADFGPGAVVYGNVFCGGYGFNSGGIFSANRLGVRPVVSLKSGITKSQLAVTSYEYKTEDIWTTDFNDTVVVNGRVTKGQVEGQGQNPE